MEYLSYKQAARFLDYATMGIRAGDIDKLLEIDDRHAWIDQQLEEPYSFHVKQLYEQQNQRSEPTLSQEMRVCAWFDIAFWSGAQLRQRMAFALSQILVVSDRDPQLKPFAKAVANYYDLLTTHAFSNYKTLLYEVTRSPVMGHYLTMVGNLPKSETGVNPDENYARELMQLFSIGLEELNMDGSLKLDVNGLPVATYDDSDVENMARVFTGWFMTDGSMIDPMTADSLYHDQEEKLILGNTIPAGLTPEQDLDLVLDILINHPNTAPFISKLLIQRFVTSNPKPAYIERVATVFANTGGQLSEVIKAVLLDPEIETINNIHRTKVREPILAMTYFCRALDCRPGASGLINYDALSYQDTFNQYPLGAPSVFNFFSPDYLPSGSLSDLNLASPELSIIDWNQVIKLSNVVWRLLRNNGFNTGSNTPQDLYPNLELLLSVAEDYEQVIEVIKRRFFYGDLPADLAPRFQDIWAARADKRVALAPMLYLAFVSPSFMVQES
ncbi:DUF1800 family protein [Vibrio astriarenae]|uniref:DUF1800 family protein n=1 Tax=Vibrio astriarenae TaxID=1481923 RepID=A0A7Z2T4H5_9VIBR|nr:DUF1800 domain-containing protein [Vibrio astriarenae]QIA64028.1 DUF1800 family protein [Vibrio astriarenae]